MVTFRFYVVSTVAFFLALAVGVVVGSVLDGRIAVGLQDRLDGLEKSLDENVAVVDSKNAEIERLDQFSDAVAPFALQGRLVDSSTVVVAEQGVSAEAVEDQVRRLRSSGSSVEGIIWLEPRWSLDDPAERERLAAELDVDSEDPAELRAAALEAVIADLTQSVAPDSTTTSSVAPDSTTTSSVVPETVPDGSDTDGTDTPVLTREVFDSTVLARLADGGFVRLQRVDGDGPVPGGELLVVSVTGEESELAGEGRSAEEVVRVAADADIAGVFAEVAASEPVLERGALVAAALERGPAVFSTVDDVDLLAGRVAVPLALAEGRLGEIGRYGYGPNTDGVLPPIPVP